MLRIRHAEDNPRPSRFARNCGILVFPALLSLALLVCGTARAQSDGSAAPADPQAIPPHAPNPASPTSPVARTPGSVSGIVLNGGGAPIAGAHIALSPANHAEAQGETTSDDTGHFRFLGVSPGAFTVLVTVQGFNSANASGELQPGQSYQLPPITLTIATVDVTVEAVTSTKELALEEMHAEEAQRLFAVFPNFFVSYNWNAPALTARQKFSLATHNVADPGNLLLVGTIAGFQQAQNAFPGYSQGAKGYGRRYGADLGNLVAGTYMGGAVLPALFHQDPRYFYKGTGTRRSRFLYAISTAVICRGDNGHRQPAFASVLGDLSAGAISNLYYDASDRQGAALTVENGLLAIAGDAMNNVFQEFVLRKLTKEGKGSKH